MGGIDSENIPAELKGWTVVTALRKSSQNLHDHIFADLYDEIITGKKTTKIQMISDDELDEESSESEPEEKGKGWTPSKHYASSSKSKSKSPEKRGRKPKGGIAKAVYQKIPKHLQKKRGR